MIHDKPKKRIVFFDGDGTLWYPKKTQHQEPPHWIYGENHTLDGYCEQLMIIPYVLAMLKKLKALNITTVLLSTHPQPKREATAIINHKAVYFQVAHLFNEIHATPLYHAAKGEYIVRILKERGIAKNRALMIGDNYRWDYKSAKDVGVDALLIDSNYRKKDRQGKRIKKLICDFRDILQYVEK